MRASARGIWLGCAALLLASGVATDVFVDWADSRERATVAAAPGDGAAASAARRVESAAAAAPDARAPRHRAGVGSDDALPATPGRGSEPAHAVPAPGEPYTNLARHLGAAYFDPRDLAALAAIIEANALDEASSELDPDDGDGALQPLELGHQVWRDGRLRELYAGPDRWQSFGYAIRLLPEQIADLEALEVLALQQSGLEALPDALAALPRLRELHVPGNRLRALPEAIGVARGLERLVLSDNEIAVLTPAIAGLAQLEALHLDHNPLRRLPDEILALESLRVLDLSAAAPLQDVPTRGELRALPEGIERLPQLESLHLSGNRLFCAAGVPLALLGDARLQVHGARHQRCTGSGS